MKAVLAALCFCAVWLWPPSQRHAPLREDGHGRVLPDSCVLNIDPYHWDKYAAATFVHNGKLVTQTQPFAERFPNRYLSDKGHKVYDDRFLEFRFGAVHLEWSGYNMADQFPQYVNFECAVGKDTMHLRTLPIVGINICYDSIPFRPGYYDLTEPPLYKRKLRPARVLFAEYYQKNSKRLERNNPFFNCKFQHYRSDRIANPGGFAPESPSDIFQFMLAQLPYYKGPVRRIVSLDKAEWRKPFRPGRSKD